MKPKNEIEIIPGNIQGLAISVFGFTIAKIAKISIRKQASFIFEGRHCFNCLKRQP